MTGFVHEPGPGAQPTPGARVVGWGTLATARSPVAANEVVPRSLKGLGLFEALGPCVVSGRKYGTPVSGWQQQLVSRIRVPDHAPHWNLKISVRLCQRARKTCDHSARKMPGHAHPAPSLHQCDTALRGQQECVLTDCWRQVTACWGCRLNGWRCRGNGKGQRQRPTAKANGKGQRQRPTLKADQMAQSGRSRKGWTATSCRRSAPPLE